jgi:hypothetical protein
MLNFRLKLVKSSDSGALMQMKVRVSSSGVCLRVEHRCRGFPFAFQVEVAGKPRQSGIATEGLPLVRATERGGFHRGVVAH